MTADLDLKRVLLEILPSSAVRAKVEELGVRNHAEMIRGRLWVIHGVIMDAQLRAMEELVLEARVKDVGAWVTDVRVAVLDLEGLLGRIVRWQPTGTFNRLQRCYSLDDDDGKGASRDAILIKLKDTAARLNVLVSRARGLNLRKEMMDSMDPCEAEFSTILKAEIVGRDEVIEDFIGKIRQRQQVSTDSVPLIVNITGDKGMGKTTVARMIYHHRWAREQFSHRIWVDPHGFLSFDPMRIATHLADSMTKKPCSHLEHHLHGIWKLVNESLRGSKYLLVLNDIRKEEFSEGDKWDKLHNILLREGGAGSTVIIVSSEDPMFKPRMVEFDVRGLSKKDWEQVFVRHAVIHPEEEEEASSAAKLLPRAILRTGNPLHAKLLASVFFRLTERSRWEAMARAVHIVKSIGYFDPFHLLDHPIVRDATEEKLSHDEGSKPPSSGYVQSPPVPRFVNLSFFSLYLLLSRDERRHLYYSFFPPGYTFDFQDLLQMLTAEGFIPHSTDKAAAIEHLQREVDSSMWRTSRFSVLDHYCGQLCLPVDWKTRALLMPLPYFLRPSILIEEEENASMDRKCQTAQIPQHESTKLTVVHVLDPLATQILKLPEEHQLLNLTYLNLSQTKLEKFPDAICYLRNLLTLKLAHCQQLKQLPEQIHDLGKLQVLNLAYCTNLRKLPNTITSLVNLEELDLEGCHSLIELPQGLNNMKSLTELNLHRCSSLTRMPRKMKQLRNLHKLSGYTAVDNLGKATRKMHALVNLEELLHLRNLEELLHLRSLEELHLRSLEGVSKPEDAEAAKLEEKPNLQSLVLQWGCQKMDDGTEASAGSSSSEVIEALRPNIGLRKLEIIAYTGEAFPSWMGIKQEYHCTLVEIKLINLRRCGSLPALGGLARLKIVEISGMQKISSVDDKFYGDNGRFSTLEKLTFSEMPKLEKWQTVVRKQDLFPKLVELTLIECPKLAKVEVRLSQVQRLNIWLDNDQLWTPTPSNFEGWDKLEELEMVGCTQLRNLPEDIKNFKCLKSLRLVGCENLISSPDWPKGYEGTLSLQISGGAALFSTPEASNLHHITSDWPKEFEGTLYWKISDGIKLKCEAKALNLLEDHPSLHRTYEDYRYHYNRFDVTDKDDEEEDHPNLPRTDEDHQDRHNLSDTIDEDRHNSPDKIDEDRSSIPPTTDEDHTKLPHITNDDYPNLSGKASEDHLNLPHITDEDSPNPPHITDEDHSSLPRITDEGHPNSPHITDEDLPSLPNITGEDHLNLPHITNQDHPTDEDRSSFSRIIDEDHPNSSHITNEDRPNLPHITGEDHSSLPPITDEDHPNLPHITNEDRPNLPHITNEDRPNLLPNEDLSSLPHITGEDHPNLSHVTDEDRSSLSHITAEDHPNSSHITNEDRPNLPHIINEDHPSRITDEDHSEPSHNPGLITDANEEKY